MSLLTLDNRLCLSPIDEHLQWVLDVGTGTGQSTPSFSMYVGTN